MFDLNKIDSVTVGVIGDLAMDIYWYADMKKSELSRETPHYPLPVVREVMSLGAGGNVAANLAALVPKKLLVCGVCGDDWRADILRRHLEDIGADTSGLITEPGRFTQTYCKPMRMGISDTVYEDPRIDFSATEDISADTEAEVLAWLDKVDGELDVLCVCDQFHHGIITDAVLKRLRSMKTLLVVDSRYRIECYGENAILKPNEDECLRALAALGESTHTTPEDMAQCLCARTGADVILTLGERGSLFMSKKRGISVKTDAVVWDCPIDICGAGDTSLSAFAATLAAGATPAEAAQVASYASAVTVRKLATTGCASRDEIVAVIKSLS